MSSRKRPLSDTLAVAETSSHRPPPALRSASPFADAARMELEAVRAELEHERSLRALEARRFQQTKSRLEQHLQVATDDAKETKAVLEETQRRSEAHMDQLRESRNDALRQLRETQEQMMDSMENEGIDLEMDMAREKEQMYEEKIEAMTEEIESLTQKLSEFEQLQEDEENDSTNENLFAEPSHMGSLAPTTVMKELNKTRLALAESERKYRQLVRKSEDWKEKSTRYAQQQEVARASATRITQLETELRNETKELEALHAENRSWNEFGKNLNHALGVTNKSKAVSIGGLSTADHAGLPPETATVIRLLENQRSEIKGLQQEKGMLQNEIQGYKNRISSTEQQAARSKSEQDKSREQIQSLENRLKQSHHEIATMRAQEGIWKRESESLRSLMKTYDAEAITPPKKPLSASQEKDVSLSTAHDEIRLLSEERTRMSEEIKSLQARMQEQKSEKERVTEKFKKLKAALMKEKEKAEQAEGRASKAEALTGQGHFNPENSRALHLKQNPLTDAIKQKYEQEINALKKQLQEGGGSSSTKPSTTKSTTPEVDPQKLHKRLKESFKEQIGLFREGVYLMTGYKVDMIQRPDNRPTFRVRSMYAERETDHLMFVWPKSTEDGAPTCLDLVATDQAKELATTDSYAYMTKFNSLPAFLASVQLTLFEKQTLV